MKKAPRVEGGNACEPRFTGQSSVLRRRRRSGGLASQSDGCQIGWRRSMLPMGGPPSRACAGGLREALRCPSERAARQGRRRREIATFDFTITEVDAGRVLGVPDGFLTALTMTTGAVHVVPDYNPATQQFTSGYLTLLGSRDVRNLMNVQPASNAHAFCGTAAYAEMVINGNLGYRGDLMVVGAPKGAVFNVTLSDQPNPRPAPGRTEWNFSGANYKPHNPPAAPKTPQGASTARKAGAILQAARSPA
jgi:hypothetical protein